jgi:lipid II:glycine glycyltransferase (peptidoglycan interpeptide bridge formation enzyme)
MSNAALHTVQVKAATLVSRPLSNGLPEGYTSEVDGLDASAWDNIVLSFADGNIYQTWAYEAQRSGTKAMSHLVLRKDGDIVAAAQMRIVKLPMLPLGVAYARWGPMWRRHGSKDDPRHLQVALACLRAEFAQRRRLALRILPLAFEHQRDVVEPLLVSEQFERLVDEGAQRTLLLPLDPPLDALRRNLDQKWRNCLNKAEKNGLELRAGDDDAIFGEFVRVYRQMHERKAFDETSSVDEFRALQAQLPEGARLRVSLALRDGQSVAGMVCSVIGDTGIYLYGATGDAGMGTNASYLVQWDAITWLKSRSARWYNLHGINPEVNPGTYRFKAGLAGRTGVDMRYLGTYQTTASPFARAIIRAASSARSLLRGLKKSRRAAPPATTSPA